MTKIPPSDGSQAKHNVPSEKDIYPHELHGFKLTIPLAVGKTLKQDIPNTIECIPNTAASVPMVRALSRRITRTPTKTSAGKTGQVFAHFAANRSYMTRVAHRLRGTTPY